MKAGVCTDPNKYTLVYTHTHTHAACWCELVVCGLWNPKDRIKFN